jgi:hypothetical protein
LAFGITTIKIINFVDWLIFEFHCSTNLQLMGVNFVTNIPHSNTAIHS